MVRNFNIKRYSFKVLYALLISSNLYSILKIIGAINGFQIGLYLLVGAAILILISWITGTDLMSEIYALKKQLARELHKLSEFQKKSAESQLESSLYVFGGCLIGGIILGLILGIL